MKPVATLRIALLDKLVRVVVRMIIAHHAGSTFPNVQDADDLMRLLDDCKSM